MLLEIKAYVLAFRYSADGKESTLRFDKMRLIKDISFDEDEIAFYKSIKIANTQNLLVSVIFVSLLNNVNFFDRYWLYLPFWNEYSLMVKIQGRTKIVSYMQRLENFNNLKVSIENPFVNDKTGLSQWNLKCKAMKAISP